MAKAVYNDWKGEFRGNAVNVLKTLIQDENRMFDKKSYYARILPIIQSSGMGKSRLLDEVSKEFLTVSFSLRRPKETGCPPGYPTVRSFLTNGPRKDEEHNARAVAFLGATLSRRKILLIWNSSCYDMLTFFF